MITIVISIAESIALRVGKERAMALLMEAVSGRIIAGEVDGEIKTETGEVQARWTVLA